MTWTPSIVGTSIDKFENKYHIVVNIRKKTQSVPIKIFDLTILRVGVNCESTQIERQVGYFQICSNEKWLSFFSAKCETEKIEYKSKICQIEYSPIYLRLTRIALFCVQNHKNINFDVNSKFIPWSLVLSVSLCLF